MEYTSKEVYEYVSKKANDPIVEWKKCHVSWQKFPIYQSDLEFYDKVSPTFEVSEDYAKEFLKKDSNSKDNFEYKDWKLKAKIPAPTLCPEERYRKKIAFRNEINLYKRTCNITWKGIVSIISPDKDITVYDQKIWRSDMRDPLNFGIEIDKHKSILQTIKELQHSVPTISLQNIWSENSEYCALGGNNKNCYLMVWNTSEDCWYWRYWTKNQNCYDFLFSENCTHCYEVTDAHNCYEVFFSKTVYNCSNSYFLTNCQNCSYCIACTNLTNKKYNIYNQQVSKDEFEDFVKKNLSQRENINNTLENVKQFNNKLPIRNMNVLDIDDNSFWNNLSHAKNVWWGFDSSGNIDGIKDCKYISLTTDISDCQDIVDSGENSAMCYDSITCTWKSILFSQNVFNSTDMLYSNMCYNCSHCLLCIWLRNNSYCILNKQYSQKEYNIIAPIVISRMIQEWIRWWFLPAKCSPFWYNETIAMLHYPLTKEEATKKWYKWSDYEPPLPNIEKIVQWKDLPKQWCKIIKEKKPEILEKILNYAIICEISKRPFRITKQEIDFYIKHNLPLPTKHPDTRHIERTETSDSNTIYLTNCDMCWKEILSIHKKGEWKIILCEKCFYKSN